MNYYKEIKTKLIENETFARIKDYSKERYKVKTYYEIGKLLYKAGNKYGEGIIKEFSDKLIKDLNKKYNVRYLFDIRKLYLFAKVHPVGAFLTMSHYRILFSIKDEAKVNYYIDLCLKLNLSKRELQDRIKNNDYERLDEKTIQKLLKKADLNIQDNIKNPILINNKCNRKIITERDLQNIILENILSFLKELGTSFSFVENEYKIKIGDRYNYIDLLLFNFEFNCFVVVELKVSELRKEYIGQIEVYMNYIDENLRKVNHDKTIGIIICKKDNHFIMEYCSDSRILSREYLII